MQKATTCNVISLKQKLLTMRISAKLQLATDLIRRRGVKQLRQQKVCELGSRSGKYYREGSAVSVHLLEAGALHKVPTKYEYSYMH